MGHDGYEGMKALHRENAYLLAQNQESCLVYGMPALPVRDGLVASAGTIPELARRIRSLLGVVT